MGINDGCSSSKSSHSSKISVEHVNTVLERLKNKQTRSSTANNYLAIWRQLNNFLIHLDIKQYHLSLEERTALFGAHLVDKGVQSSTLKSYFSAIKHVLKQDGYTWDDNKVILSSLVKGCKLENDRVKVRLPIKKGLLEMLLFEVERTFGGFYGKAPQPYLETMYTALFCLAYYGMLRVGELTLSPHTIKAANIHVGHNKDKILLVLYSSKTHGKESRPQKIKITATKEGRSFNNRNMFFCPFEAVTKYMGLKHFYAEDDDPLFVFADNSPIKDFHVRQILRQLLDKLSLDSKLYDVHSFRIGRTCDLQKYGYSIDQIKAMGRWKSNAVYKYLKN